MRLIPHWFRRKSPVVSDLVLVVSLAGDVLAYRPMVLLRFPQEVTSFGAGGEVVTVQVVERSTLFDGSYNV